MRKRREAIEAIRGARPTSCCCAVCGNCTKSPTYDNRDGCCCVACGHCFKSHNWYLPYYQTGPIWTFGDGTNGNPNWAPPIVTSTVYMALSSAVN